MTIINTYDQLIHAVHEHLIDQQQAISIGYLPYEGRAAGGQCWQVYSPYFKTDPQSAWFERGCKSFYCNRETSREKRLEAIAWASTQYNIQDWKRNRMGDYVPAIVQDKLPIPKRKETP